MNSENENNFWYVLFAVHGKAVKIRPYLETANIEYFYPMFLKERKMIGTERKRLTVQPLLGNLLFVKSSRKLLDPLLAEVKLRLTIDSGLYLRDKETKQPITIPDEQMRNFIAVVNSKHKQVIYLTNEEVNFQNGAKVRVTGGVFEGVEGVIMRSKGKNRVVVFIPNLLSVATAFIPPCFISPIE
jgi:transcription antitermination factor NusG